MVIVLKIDTLSLLQLIHEGDLSFDVEVLATLSREGIALKPVSP